ncbi:hypothetical protein [Umezawaea sp.]|uniref:hypothetical protein n=1 Tax=Umezawaea sp. TaxID=1955258 RepID=UPI002ED37A39
MDGRDPEVALAFHRTPDPDREGEFPLGRSPRVETNPEPARFHVHTIVRSPNGDDHGRDLLAQHHRLHHGGGGAG